MNQAPLVADEFGLLLFIGAEFGERAVAAVEWRRAARVGGDQRAVQFFADVLRAVRRVEMRGSGELGGDLQSVKEGGGFAGVDA